MLWENKAIANTNYESHGILQELGQTMIFDLTIRFQKTGLQLFNTID